MAFGVQITFSHASSSTLTELCAYLEVPGLGVFLDKPAPVTRTLSRIWFWEVLLALGRLLCSEGQGKVQFWKG